MLNLITKGVAKVFGTKSERDIKVLLPLVTQINEEYKKLKKVSNDELRAQTQKIQKEIDDYLKDIDGQIEEKHEKANIDPDMDLATKEALFDEIDELEKKRNELLEDVLQVVLPRAFAIVKDTARRFMENAEIEVTANEADRKFASTKEHIQINGEKAVWKNRWKAAGTEVEWNMLHYDVQLIGGIVLHQGKIAEMATGEGKTLVATLPAFLNALSRRGVHIVTVNDYLAKRDSEWMAPLFEFHGLRVDCIDKYQPNGPERREAYQKDIIYGTNNEFGFDYLRDNMARELGELVQRKHHFAMVDEVDSVLIDDARTPLIISGPVPKSDEHQFDELKPKVTKLYEAQKKVASEFIQEAKKLIKEGKDKEAGLPLLRAYRALPKSKPLIKLLSETGVRALLQKTENQYLQDNQREMPKADAPLYFTIDEKNNNIELTDNGVTLLSKDSSDDNFFILPDISTEIDKVEKDSGLDNQEKVEKKESIINDYKLKTDRIHTVNQLLKAYTLFEKDTDYIIQQGKVMIVDEQTGRVMEGRRYSDGLHQALEAKENVKIEDATQTYATVTLQNYFRMYHKLAGMTGTAETEAGEFWEIYKLDVVVIPTNKPIVRDDRQDLVYKTVKEKFNAVVQEINELTAAGRPVLVGTTSVEISELLSRMLKLRKIKHQVLNAKQHAKEADVVAEAGKPGTVTIATNMAGRGTDIKLAPESKNAGGLAIIGTERHESRRVDRQLRGRSGRQGDPGSSQFFVSLEDNLMRIFGSERIAKMMDRMGLKEGEVIQHSMITKSIERAQRKVEENNFGIRKRLLEYDDVMNSQREVIYTRRRNALYGERLELDVLNMIYDTAEDVINRSKTSMSFPDLQLSVLGTFGFEWSIKEDEFEKDSHDKLVVRLYRDALTHYNEKKKRIAEQNSPVIKSIYKERGAVMENIFVPFTDGKRKIGVAVNLEKANNNDAKELNMAMEKYISLAIIDQKWTDHLRDMDDLKQSVQTASFEQKDPLLIYKFEAYELFKTFLVGLNEEIISFLMRAEIEVQDPQQVQEARAQRRQKALNEQKADFNSSLNAQANPTSEPAEKLAPRRSEKIMGRNERVSVQYNDGSIKKDVKFKTVEADVKSNKCTILED